MFLSEREETDEGQESQDSLPDGVNDMSMYICMQPIYQSINAYYEIVIKSLWWMMT